MAKKLGCASCGGTKKMANGGPINKPMTYAPRQKGDTNQHMGIFGAPQIGQGAMDGKTGQMKKGGVTVSRAVQASCKNGYVRSADGGCVKARPIQFQTGGIFSPAKRAERKVTRAIKKSVKNSGKIIKNG
jgi:hypothetical protein